MKPLRHILLTGVFITFCFTLFAQATAPNNQNKDYTFVNIRDALFIDSSIGQSISDFYYKYSPLAAMTLDPTDPPLRIQVVAEKRTALHLQNRLSAMGKYGHYVISNPKDLPIDEVDLIVATDHLEKELSDHQKEKSLVLDKVQFRKLLMFSQRSEAGKKILNKQIENASFQRLIVPAQIGLSCLENFLSIKSLGLLFSIIAILTLGCFYRKPKQLGFIGGTFIVMCLVISVSIPKPPTTTNPSIQSFLKESSFPYPVLSYYAHADIPKKGLNETTKKALSEKIMPLLSNESALIRLYAAQIAGNLGLLALSEKLRHLGETDTIINVRYKAYEALGKIQSKDNINFLKQRAVANISLYEKYYLIDALRRYRISFSTISKKVKSAL